MELKLKHDVGMKLIINKSIINLSKNPLTHGRSKHIVHYLRDQVNEGKLDLICCNTHHQVTNVFTKSTRAERFKFER